MTPNQSCQRFRSIFTDAKPPDSILCVAEGLAAAARIYPVAMARQFLSKDSPAILVSEGVPWLRDQIVERMITHPGNNDQLLDAMLALAACAPSIAANMVPKAGIPVDPDHPLVWGYPDRKVFSKTLSQKMLTYSKAKYAQQEQSVSPADVACVLGEVLTETGAVPHAMLRPIQAFLSAFGTNSELAITRAMLWGGIIAYQLNFRGIPWTPGTTHPEKPPNHPGMLPRSHINAASWVHSALKSTIGHPIQVAPHSSGLPPIMREAFYSSVSKDPCDHLSLATATYLMSAYSGSCGPSFDDLSGGEGSHQQGPQRLAKALFFDVTKYIGKDFNDPIHSLNGSGDEFRRWIELGGSHNPLCDQVPQKTIAQHAWAIMEKNSSGRRKS
jgi:hypothetical protein